MSDLLGIRCGGGTVPIADHRRSARPEQASRSSELQWKRELGSCAQMSARLALSGRSGLTRMHKRGATPSLAPVAQRDGPLKGIFPRRPGQGKIGPIRGRRPREHRLNRRWSRQAAPRLTIESTTRRAPLESISSRSPLRNSSRGMAPRSFWMPWARSETDSAS